MDDNTKKAVEYYLSDARLKTQQAWDSIDLIIIKLKSKNIDSSKFVNIQEKLWMELRQLDVIYFGLNL
jgi:hypothetical protein